MKRYYISVIKQHLTIKKILSFSIHHVVSGSVCCLGGITMSNYRWKRKYINVCVSLNVKDSIISQFTFIEYLLPDACRLHTFQVCTCMGVYA